VSLVTTFHSSCGVSHNVLKCIESDYMYSILYHYQSTTTDYISIAVSTILHLDG